MSYKDWLATRKPSSRAAARQAARENPNHTWDSDLPPGTDLPRRCTRCGASVGVGRGYLSRSCPGQPPSATQQLELRLGTVDYVNGEWVRLDGEPPF